jgi:hypothetical protein
MSSHVSPNLCKYSVVSHKAANREEKLTTKLAHMKATLAEVEAIYTYTYLHVLTSSRVRICTHTYTYLQMSTRACTDVTIRAFADWTMSLRTMCESVPLSVSS